MIKIVLPNQLYLIGKVSDLLEVLEDYSKKYATVKELIEEQIIH
ncbi:MAG: Z-ring formation inhibitor MciZ [Alkaliphilus sp.]|nr:Z-ring formation inhibitor MciZ [Alkaliphilus sp.]